MRNLFLILLVWLGTVTLFGQSIPDSLEQEGTVTYISSQNIYIRFESTKDIQPGDTLFIKKEEKLLPALLVKHLSSSSVVATPLTDEIPPKETKIYAVNRRSAVTEQPSETPIVIAIQQAEEKIIPDEEPLFETSESR